MHRLSWGFGLMKYLPLVFIVVTLAAAMACGKYEPKEHTFNLSIQDQSLKKGSSILKVNQNDQVEIIVAVDENLLFHLHGYDIEKESTPEKPAKLMFEANATGSFPFTIHAVGIDHQDHHDHHERESCTATIPSGTPKPSLQVTASLGEKPGEIEVSVQVKNFALSNEKDQTNLASGHWHLFVDGDLVGMYTKEKIHVPLSTSGEHKIMAGLSDRNHCDYGIHAMTTVTVGKGTSVEDHGTHKEDAEIEIGRLEVQPH